MKTRNPFIVTVMMTAVMLMACQCNGRVEPAPGPDPKPAERPEITVSAPDVILVYPASFGVSSEISFEVKSDTPVSSLLATATEGLSAGLTASDDRTSGKVTVSATGKLSRTGEAVHITATNEGGTTTVSVPALEAFLEIARSSADVPAAGATIALTVSANVPCSVAVDGSPDWVFALLSDDILSVSVARNTSFEQRRAVVTVSETGGPLSATFTVTQAAAIDYSSVERRALEAFWKATGGERWKQLSNSTGGMEYSTANWCTDAPLGTWYGVTLNPEGRVIYLHLADAGLEGMLPEELGDLAYLQELWLSGNALSGPLPASIGKLSVLKDVDLSGMAMTGRLEDSTLGDIAHHLKSLSLSGNLFTGGFPEWVGDMPEGANFWLQGNCLEGKVPDRVKAHPRWNAEAMDGTGRTIGQINMVQRDGYELSL